MGKAINIKFNNGITQEFDVSDFTVIKNNDSQTIVSAVASGKIITITIQNEIYNGDVLTIATTASIRDKFGQLFGSITTTAVNNNTPIEYIASGVPKPFRHLSVRDGLTLTDSVGGNDATIGKFPAVNMATSGVLYSRFVTEFSEAITTDWTVLVALRKKDAVDSKLHFRVAEFNVAPSSILSSAPSCNYGIPLYFPPSYPSFDFSEVQILGYQYDLSEDEVSSIWNEKLETVANTLTQALQNVYVGTLASNTDNYVLGIFVYGRIISDAEIALMRSDGIVPIGNEKVIYPFTNSKDTIWIEQFDAVSRLSGDSTTHGWLNNGTTNSTPDDPFAIRFDDKLSAYNLFNGFSEQGIHQMPYKPDGTKGSGSDENDVEHLASGVIHNLADSYIEMNKDDHAMDWDDMDDRVFAVFDKSNRTVWKSTIEGDHYIQNDDSNYTLWHSSELNDEYIARHAQSGYENIIFCGLRTSGGNLTGITEIAIYRENQT